MTNGPFIPGCAPTLSGSTWRSRAHVDEVLELLAHDVSAGNRAADHRIVQHAPDFRWVGASENLLPGHASHHPAFECLGVRSGLPGANDRTGVVLGLEQPWNEHRFVCVESGGFGLQSHIRAAAENVAIASPPAAPSCFSGQLDEGVAGRLIGDAVYLQQVADVAGLDPRLAGLDSADLRR